MAQISGTPSNIHAIPNPVREAIQANEQKQKTPPVNQKLDNNAPQQEDRVDLAKPNLRQSTVTQETQKVDRNHEKRVNNENPAVTAPQQNSGNINLATQQEPEERRAPRVDSHSIRTTIQEGASHRKEPSVVELQIKEAANPKAKANTGQTEARNNEANAHVQVRGEQNQNANETELRRSPAAVQTQKGQNVDKLT